MSAGEKLPGTPEPMIRVEGAGGLALAADAFGPAQGPLVVLLHGGGQTRHAWKNVGTTLGESGYRVVAFDARGHGDSDWARDGRYDPDVMVEDLRRVIAHFGGERPALVGASMGGGTSLIAVGERSVEASALVLVDIAARLEPEGVERIRAFMDDRPDGFSSLDDVADAISRYQPQRPRPPTTDGLAKNLRLGGDGRYRWHWDPRMRVGRSELVLRQERLQACARSVDIPTLLVRGSLSDVLSDDGVRDFLALCPHAEYVDVQGAGHMVAGDDNDVFGRVVIDFLDRTRGPAADRPDIDALP